MSRLGIRDEEALWPGKEQVRLYISPGPKSCPGRSEFQIDPGNERVGQKGSPELCKDSIGGAPPEVEDLEVLLDPLEERLDLPPVLIQPGDGAGGEIEAIGQVDQAFARVGIPVTDSAQRAIAVDGTAATGQGNLLIREDSDSGGWDRSSPEDPILRSPLHACNKDRVLIVKSGEELGINVGAIDDENRAWRDGHLFSHRKVVGSSVADERQFRESRLVTVQDVEFDGRPLSGNHRPGEQVVTQLDRGRVQTVHDPSQSMGASLDFFAACVQDLGEDSADELVGPVVIGVGYSRAGEFRDSQRLSQEGEVVPDGEQVAEAFYAPEVSEEEDKEVVLTAVGADTTVSLEFGDRLLHQRVGNQPSNLLEQGATLRHGLSLLAHEVEGWFVVSSFIPQGREFSSLLCK